MNYGQSNVNSLMRHLASKSEKRYRKISIGLMQVILLLLVAAAVLAACIGIGAFRAIIDTAPDIGNIDVTPTGYSTFVFDKDGNQTAKLVSTDSNRIPVTLDMVPEDLQHAFVAIEDSRFYDHHGIDIQGILRAGVIGITTGNFSEGASTITQQLLKNNVFTGWTSESFAESVKRKIQEQFLAVELEKKMSKDDILLNYMNTINLGHNTLGVQAASLRYFGKSVSDLTLSEDAVIAGITQNPTKYDPITYPKNNAERRKKVLDNMLDQGYITQDAYNDAVADNVYSRIQVIDEETDDEEVNSYFVDALTNQVLNDLMDKGYTETQAYTLLYSGGLNIYSTQDPDIQKICDDVCLDPDTYPAGTQYLLSYKLSLSDSSGEVTNYSSEMLRQWMVDNGLGTGLLFASEEDARAMAEKYKESVMTSGQKVEGESIGLTPQPQISFTVEDQSTGDIVAIVGGRGDKTANRTLNRATDSMRQPGSTFKVVSTYAPALDAAGLTLASTQEDAPYQYDDGTPVRNWYGEAYRGWSSLRLGIQNSMNIVAVKTLQQITPQLGIEYLKNFGITTLVDNRELNGKVYSDCQLALALGGITDGVKNIELNGAYATIANGGIYNKPTFYSKITDHDGNVIIDKTKDNETRRVLKETTAWLLTSAMEDVVQKGTGTRCNFGTTAIAGKTGTTSDYNDVWFCGFTGYYTASAWAGYDDNTKLSNSQEKGLAQTIWVTCMKKIHENLSYKDFVQPAGITTASICTKSGKLPVDGLCNGTIGTEYFAEGTVPTDSCDSSYHAGETPATTTAAPVDAATQAALDQANATLQAATAQLQQAQATMVAAQQMGDQATIDSAAAQVNQATAVYNAALAQQSAAQQAYNQAAAAAAAAAQQQTAGGDAAGTGAADGAATPVNP
jgi:penicillin-binding protein 1A